MSHTVSSFSYSSVNVAKSMYLKNLIVVLLAKLLTGVRCDWIEITRSPTQIDTHQKDLENLKYEDLVHVVGPGFESEFQKFIIRQSQILNSNAVAADKYQDDVENGTSQVPKSNEICTKEQKADYCSNRRNKSSAIALNQEASLNSPATKTDRHRKQKHSKSNSFFNFSSIRKYIQNIQETLVLGAASEVHDKIKLLESLRDQMVYSIGE